jgi:malate dehydrogenase (quinone)
MINVVETCFPQKMATAAWQTKMKTMIPSYGQSLIDDAELLKTIRARTTRTLGLTS